MITQLDIALVEKFLRPHLEFSTTGSGGKLFKDYKTGKLYLFIVAKREMNGRVPFKKVELPNSFYHLTKAVKKAAEELNEILRDKR